MAIQRFKLAMNNASFPLVSTKAQRAVVIPGLDAAPRTPRGFYGQSASIDANTAQVIYAENVMPVAEGLHSVGYSRFIAPTIESDFDSIFALRDADENTVLYSPAKGKNYIYDDTASAWANTPIASLIAPATLAAGSDPAESRVTYAYVDGKTFVCFSRLQLDPEQPDNPTGTYDSSGSTGLAVNFNGTDYVLGTDAELTAAGDDWTLDITADLPLDIGVYLLTAVATPTVGDPVVTTQTITVGGDASIYFWNGTALEPAGGLITNSPFPVGEIDGIANSNGYLLIWSGLEVAWAPFNGTSFNYEFYASGNFTGAGRQIPEDIQGNIRAIISLAGGFAMFTDRNAVAASYHAQTIQAPWVFREIPDAGGLESYEQATVEGTLGSVYAYTTAGMQQISLNSAKLIMPEVSDFIAGRQIEHYRYDLQQIYQGGLNLDMFVKVTNVANRYLVVSYGTFPRVYSYALVFDMALERWGKLRMVHRDCFYYAYGAIQGALTYAAAHDIPYNHPELSTYAAAGTTSNAFTAAQHGLAFLKETGEVVIANWSEQLRTEDDSAVAIIGRVQLSRAAHVQLNVIEVENVSGASIYIQPSYDGRNLVQAVEMVDIGSSEGLGRFGTQVDCKNFNTVIQGTFDLSTLIFEGTTSGRI